MISTCILIACCTLASCGWLWELRTSRRLRVERDRAERGWAEAESILLKVALLHDASRVPTFTRVPRKTVGPS